MRKIFIIFLFLVLVSGTSKATECTNYLTNIYSNDKELSVKIISKTEHNDKYEQKIGDYYVSSITYGTGWMKCSRRKKMRISYITIYDKNCKPIWGYVIPR